MGGLRIIYEGAIIGTGGNLLGGLAFDGRYLYSSAPAEKTIYRLDENGGILQKYRTVRSYVGLCYDRINRCFWAISRESPLYIFRLTPQFEEFDRVRIFGRIAAQPRAVDMDPEQGCLLVAAGENLLTVSLSGEINGIVPAPFSTCDLSAFGEHLLLGGTGLDIHNRHMGFIESFALPSTIRVSGVSVLYHSPDRMVCTVLCTRSYRYNGILQVVIEPAKPLEGTADNSLATAFMQPGSQDGLQAELAGSFCPECPVQGSVSAGLSALSGVLEQLLAALVQSAGDPPVEER